MCVQSTVLRQTDADGERLILPLFNGINTTTDHGLPEVAVPLREEAVPVGGIKVRFRGQGLGRIHLEPEGMELAPKVNGDWTEVEVPPVAVHAMVIAEVKPQ